MDFDEAFAAALAHQRAKRLAEAEDLYRRILAADPSHAPSLYRLGAVAMQTGRTEAAIVWMLRAIEHGRPDQNAEFHQGVAFAYRRMADLDNAERHYRLALALDPRSVDAQLNLGAVLRQLDRLDEAEAACRAAVALAPADAQAAYNLAAVLVDLGRHDEAAADFRRATALDPGLIPPRKALAILLNRLGQFGQAEACCREALAIAPDEPGLLNTLGVAIKEQERPDEAGAAFERVLALRPDHAEALYNLGTVRKDQGRTDEAVACFRRAAVLEPGLAAARFALCMAHLPPLYGDEAEIDRRRGDYERELRDLVKAAETTGAGALAEGVGASQPFYLAYQGRDDLTLQRLYGDLVCRAMAERFGPVALSGPPADGEPLRVGFVSGFFRRHANWNMPIRGWLSQLDRSRFRLFGYHTGTILDDVTAEAAGLCERFVQGPLPLDRWRRIIAADAPHVLIYPEVGMDPMAARLAAMRLAPVQCNAWGHPVTSGFPTLDYYLSSDLMEPEDGDRHYCERLVRLPNLSVFCEPPAAAATGPAAPSGPVTFWCGQSLYKYLPQFDRLFPAIAARVGDCRFVFIEFPGSPELTRRFQARLRMAFEEFGLNAEDYCLILPRLPPGDYAAAMGRAEVVLDSLGWSGCNSLIDALAFDPPIVTLPGPFMRGRHGAAILSRIGETRTIARDADDFVAIAARLARDADFRGEVSRSMAAGKGRVFGDRACITALEDFLARAVAAVAA